MACGLHRTSRAAAAPRQAAAPLYLPCISRASPVHLQARERSGAAEVQRSLDRAMAKQRQAEEQARCSPARAPPASMHVHVAACE